MKKSEIALILLWVAVMFFWCGFRCGQDTAHIELTQAALDEAADNAHADALKRHDAKVQKSQ